MSFLDKIKKPALMLGGAALLGSYFFPETTFGATGGLLGTDPMSAGGSSFIGPLLSGGTAAATGGASIWANPTVLSSGILAGTSLLTGLFGSSAEEDNAQLMRDKLDEEKRQFDATLALKQSDMAQAIEIAKIQAGASGAAARAGAGAQVASANIGRDSALRQARASVIQNAATQKSQALQIPLAARGEQAERAQNTGLQSGIFFNSLIPNLQRPALRGA